MTKCINGKAITAYAFGFDGCHKIYLVENGEDEELLRSFDYEIYDIDGLPRAWADSCPLRFIETADLSETVVPQCTPAYFTGDWVIDPQLQWELTDMAEYQIEINAEAEAQMEK